MGQRTHPEIFPYKLGPFANAWKQSSCRQRPEWWQTLQPIIHGSLRTFYVRQCSCILRIGGKERDLKLPCQMLITTVGNLVSNQYELNCNQCSKEHQFMWNIYCTCVPILTLVEEIYGIKSTTHKGRPVSSPWRPWARPNSACCLYP